MALTPKQLALARLGIGSVASPSTTTTTITIPGPAGKDGVDGKDGEDGVDASPVLYDEINGGSPLDGGGSDIIIDGGSPAS